MACWKRALIYSSMGAGVALFVSGRRVAGAALTSAGIGGLVYEHRGTLTRVAPELPQFLARTTQVAQTVAALGQRLMQARSSAGRTVS